MIAPPGVLSRAMPLLLLALMFLTATASAGERAICGTSPEVDMRTRAIARAVSERARSLARVEQPSRVVNDFLLVPSDDETAPFDDPADLEGISLRFTRTEDGFAVQRGVLEYDTAIGERYESFPRGTATRELDLGFPFPFGDAEHPVVTLSSSRGIYFEPSPILSSRNFAAIEVLTSGTPVLSPLLDYVESPSGRPDVFVKKTGDAVTITWKSQGEGLTSFDLQAVLHRNGDVQFHYAKVQGIAWGGVVVNRGTATAGPRQMLLRAEDPTGDVEPIFGESREMLDLTQVSVARVDGTSMLALELTVAAPVDREVLNRDARFLVTLADSINRIELAIHRDETILHVPNVGDLSNTAVEIDGRTITIFIDEELLDLRQRATRMWIHTSARLNADAFEANLDLGAVPRSAETDFSSLSPFETTQPIVETFTLPTVNLTGVWERLVRERGYRDDEIDAVFVYSSFLTDMIHQPYLAFALYANPGADGVSAHSSKAAPRTPTLINMNRLGLLPDYGTNIVMHEFGHRWLYYFEMIEDGVRSRSTNPSGMHPAGYTHTPAAFSVRSPDDASAMGGASFMELPNNQFRTPSSSGWDIAFSWPELYLMGLARPEEVPGWFYIRDSDPALPPEYHPAAGVTVTGTRVDVRLQQIVEAMGPRDPSYATSQKDFRVLFVVLERAGQPLAPEVLDPAYRLRFEDAFRRATGGRATITSRVHADARRRAVRK